MFQPELEEPLPADAKIKFLYGSVLEELLLSLAEAAGHQVEARQAEVSMLGLTGHIDAIIDGMLVDVKSASTFAFQKFQNHLTSDKDSFGYLYQLGFYLEALQSNPSLRIKDRAAFLVVDKTLGKICLDVHSRDSLKRDWAEAVERKSQALTSVEMPSRGYFPEPDGKSGNLKLGLACSYCSFKEACYPRLRTFAYSTGPRFLTHVAREPDVPEFKGKSPVDTD